MRLHVRARRADCAVTLTRGQDAVSRHAYRVDKDELAIDTVVP